MKLLDIAFKAAVSYVIAWLIVTLGDTGPDYYNPCG